MRLWGRFYGKPKVGETKPAPPETVLIEFVCMTEGCEFQTLSLTDAYHHLVETTVHFHLGNTPLKVHNVEPRGYYYKKEPL